MRRLCLFVHTPVTPTLGLGIHSLASGDLFVPHALKLDEELFPLLLEAKPCVILASISDNETSGSVYNLMREFKEFRMGNGSAARDPGVRIVIVSEGQIPRLNWASLGIYELIIGPVQANVLTYKLNRHYQKAVDAGEPEPDTNSANLVKDVEMKAEASSSPEWKTFTSSPFEKLQTRLFKKTEKEVKEISLRVAIPGLIPSAGKWKKSEVQMDPPPEWNWEYSQETPEGTTQWSFRGEEPLYHPEDGTWQFISTVPKLMSYGRNSTGAPDVQFEYVQKPNADGEGRLNVKSDLQVKSIRTQTYREPNSEDDPLIVDDSKEIAEGEISPDEIAAAMADLENAILQKKQNYGEMPREREASKGPGYGDAPGEREDNPDTNSPESRDRNREKPKPNYGDRPRDRDGSTEAAALAEKKPRSAREGVKPIYPPLRENEEEPESAESSGRAKSGGFEKNANLNPKLESGPGEPAKNTDLFPTDRGSKEKKKLPDSGALNLDSKSALAKQKYAPLNDNKNLDSKDQAAPASPSEVLPTKAPPGIFPTREADGERKQSAPARAEVSLASNPKINADPSSTLSANLQTSQNESTTDALKKKFRTDADTSKKSTRILDDEVNGSMSALYDDDEKAKAKRKERTPEESTDIELFSQHVWKFRLVKRANLSKNKHPGATGAQKISLAPQQKLSLEEKRSLVDRIMRFIVEFFTRTSGE